MHTLPDALLYQGVAVDILFGEPRPVLGDLLLICGEEPHPQYPPSGTRGIDRLADLQFTSLDDYYGIRSLADDGADVAVWLYPIIDDRPVHHHVGPYDGFRLSYNVLRNPIRFVDHYLQCVEGFASVALRVRYASRQRELGTPPDLSTLRTDVDAIVSYWAARGVQVGSEAALLIDY